MIGRIIQGVGGLYEVEADDERFFCRARGKFRKEALVPLVGDFVAFDAPTATQEGRMNEILPRKNVTVRPAVANIDTMVIVLAGVPQPDLALVDKLLVQAHLAGIRPLLCVNKCDEGGEHIQDITRQYEKACTILHLSAKEEMGIEALRGQIAGGVACFAGQSGVGKTSLLNALSKEHKEKTGAVSEKIGRGKHTTRQATLLPVGNGFVVDTPGFSVFSLEDVVPGELAVAYAEFRPFLGQCRFPSCEHRGEPECAVLEAIERGDISPKRYERYLMLLDQMKERWRRQYD